MPRSTEEQMMKQGTATGFVQATVQFQGYEQKLAV
jgi:hypothetical protein